MRNHKVNEANISQSSLIKFQLAECNAIVLITLAINRESYSCANAVYNIWNVLTIISGYCKVFYEIVN